MIVIGEKHSSNTQKLKKICLEIISTYHIETVKELKPSWFKNKKLCGVTAGTSTPKWVIDETINQIKKY